MIGPHHLEAALLIPLPRQLVRTRASNPAGRETLRSGPGPMPSHPDLTTPIIDRELRAQTTTGCLFPTLDPAGQMTLERALQGKLTALTDRL